MIDPKVSDVLTRYGLTFDFADFGGSVISMYDACWAIDAEIKKAREDKSESVKVASHPYDVKAKEDKAAAQIAHNLVSAFTNAVSVAITKNANVAWHLSELPISQWITQELQYRRLQEQPNRAPTSGSKLEQLYEDRKELKQQLDKLFAAAIQLKDLKRTVQNEQGEEVEEFVFRRNEKGDIDLPTLQGRTGVTEVPTGRDAKRLQEYWFIDGKPVEKGTPIREIVRMVWSGIDSVGKKNADITDPIDAARKKWKKGTAPEVTVTINKKKITNRWEEVETS